MNRSEVFSSMREQGLRITPLKREIVELFLGGACGVPLADVRRRVTTPCNQSSVYRCLRSLAEVNFLRHSIGRQGVVRYRCTERYSVPHGHFRCRSCEGILPVSGYSREFVKEIETRYGVIVDNFDFILEGRCPDCSAEH